MMRRDRHQDGGLPIRSISDTVVGLESPPVLTIMFYKYQRMMRWVANHQLGRDHLTKGAVGKEPLIEPDICQMSDL